MKNVSELVGDASWLDCFVELNHLFSVLGQEDKRARLQSRLVTLAPWLDDFIPATDAPNGGRDGGECVQGMCSVSNGVQVLPESARTLVLKVSAEYWMLAQSLRQQLVPHIPAIIYGAKPSEQLVATQSIVARTLSLADVLANQAMEGKP